MKVIRVVGVGLLASAWIMSQLSLDFFRAWMSASAVNSFILAMKSLSPPAFDGTGMGATAVIVLALTSLGLGLLASAVLYSPLDDVLASVLRSRSVAHREHARRADAGMLVSER
jgi:hypothetical protein